MKSVSEMLLIPRLSAPPGLVLHNMASTVILRTYMSHYLRKHRSQKITLSLPRMSFCPFSALKTLALSRSSSTVPSGAFPSFPWSEITSRLHCTLWLCCGFSCLSILKSEQIGFLHSEDKDSPYLHLSLPLPKIVSCSEGHLFDLF